MALLSDIRRHVFPACALFSCLAFSLGSLCAEDLRLWTDASGAFKKQAVFQRLEDEFVILKLEDGEMRRIPLAKLSRADQEYAKVASARAEAADPFEAIATQGSRTPSAPSSGTTAISLGEGDSSIRVVTVEGVGVDVASAKTDAYREAVRQVVGAFVDSASLASNDQLIEDKVITLSSAFVEKSEPLRETQDGRLMRVRLRAHVRVNKLLDALRGNKISTLKVDSESLLSQAVTKADQAEGMKELVRRTLPGLQKAFLRATAEGKPEIKTASGDDAEVAFWLRIKPQLDAYLPLATKIDAAFSASERPAGEIVSDGTLPPNGDGYHDYITNWKTNYAWMHIANLFADTSRKAVEESIDSRTGLTPLLKYEPLYAFPTNLFGTKSYENAVRALSKDGGQILLMLVHSSETGARARWKWVYLTAEECQVVADSLRNILTDAVTVLRDNKGNEVARDAVRFRWVGCRFLDSDKSILVISPFFMPGETAVFRVYAPSLQVKRTVKLTKREVSMVDRSDAFIEPAEASD